MMLVSAVAAELGDLPGTPVGIGVLEALVGTERVIRDHHPEHVVFVGSAGALADLPVGTACFGTTVAFGDAALVLGLGYTPKPTPVIALTPWGFGVPARLITCVAITTDPALTARYRQAADVEHMEAWAVAWACARAGVRCSVVLGIANRVGPDAHREWLANRGAAEAAARSTVERALRPTAR